MPSESDLLTLRLSRIKALIDTLEEVCSNSREHRETFVAIRTELTAARDGLKPVSSPNKRD